MEKVKSVNKYKLIKTKSKLMNFAWSLFRIFLIIGISYIIVYPILFMISTALRGSEDYYNPMVIWLPLHYSPDSFKNAIKLLDYWNTLGRTAFYSVGASLIQAVICAFTGYGLARFKFKGKNLVLLGVILTIIVPNQTIIVPLYEQYRFFDFFGIGRLIELISGLSLEVNLTDTGWVYFLPSLFGNGLRSGLFVLVFMQSFRGFPRSIEEAAEIDGCSSLKCYLTIIVPNAINSFVTVFLFSLVWHWGDYYYAGMLMGSGSTLAVALKSLPTTAQTMFSTTSDPVANSVCVQAGCLLVILPLLIIFFIGQKSFVESVERTGMVE